MKKKSRLARKMPGTNSLWKIADRTGTLFQMALFQMAQMRISWPDNVRLLVDKAGDLDPESFLKWTQGARDAGRFKAGYEDMALVLIFGTVVYLEEENLGLAKTDAGVMDAFPGQRDIIKKMDAIATREGLKDGEYWQQFGGTKPAPEDWLALDAEYNRVREKELPKIYAALLHGYGEYGIEALCLDGKIYDRVEAFVRNFFPSMYDAMQKPPLNENMKKDRAGILTELAKIMAENLADAYLRQAEEDNKPGVTGSC